MQYISTRGQAPRLGFSEATLVGLATDGGLYIPEHWPTVSHAQIRQMRGLSYPQLAARILRNFTGDQFSSATLSTMTSNAYGHFHHHSIAPLKQLDTDLYVLELFHGPTLSFKDFALQFLGQMFNHLLAANGNTCTIVGATSGDTGSAAIEAVRGLDAVKLYMLHPKGKVSNVQRRQMTTVMDNNIHNLAIDGTFDDCQNLVKAMFNDAGFRRRHNLAAVNSINWARIAAQVVYYFHAALALGAPEKAVNFAVPTGNFGNVLAGYVALKMGLPINRLIIGSNSNDILTRFFETGKMQPRGVSPTLSPSMDIQISSNFERYLFELFDRDSAHIRNLMQSLSTDGGFAISQQKLQQAKQVFTAHRCNDNATRAEMGRVFKQTGEIIDPHSVIGVAAARKHADNGVPTVVVGTAHAAKFADAVAAATGKTPELPAFAAHIMQGDEQVEYLDNDLIKLQQHIDKG